MMSFLCRTGLEAAFFPGQRKHCPDFHVKLVKGFSLGKLAENLLNVLCSNLIICLLDTSKGKACVGW